MTNSIENFPLLEVVTAFSTAMGLKLPCELVETNSQVMLGQPSLGPHLENHCVG